MSQTTTHGLVKPSTGDAMTGSYAAIEDAIQRLNDHTHNGSNTEKLVGPTSADAYVQAVSAASWGSDLGGGSYRQLITLPATYDFDTLVIQARTTAGVMIYPTIVKVSDTTFYIYTNDNSVAMNLLYGS